MWSLKCGTNNNLENRIDHGHVGHTCDCQGGGGESGMDWKFGVNRCKLLHLEWISNKILLYSPGNYIWSLMMEHDGGRCEKNNIYICVCLCVCVCVCVCVCMTGSLCCTVKIEHCKSSTKTEKMKIIKNRQMNV